jgi:hypothetical protein
VIADPANDRAIVVLTNSENGPRIYERVIVAVKGTITRPSSGSSRSLSQLNCHSEQGEESTPQPPELG